MSLFAGPPSQTHPAAMQKNPVLITETEAFSATIGDTIRTTRKAKHLSQKSLASLCGITPVQLNRIEAGDSIPSKNSLKALSAHLCIPYTQLLLMAGYNNMSGEFNLYKRDGSELNIEAIVCSIYKADSDLLDLFQDFDKIADSEDVEVIKLLLKAMRKEMDQCLDLSQLEQQLFAYFRKTFQALKTFIISSLSPMTE